MTEVFGALLLLTMVIFVVRYWLKGHWFACTVMFFPATIIVFVIITLTLMMFQPTPKPTVAVRAAVPQDFDAHLDVSRMLEEASKGTFKPPSKPAEPDLFDTLGVARPSAATAWFDNAPAAAAVPFKPVEPPWLLIYFLSCVGGFCIAKAPQWQWYRRRDDARPQVRIEPQPPSAGRTL